ncbi:MAG: acetyl-coenzyme A synthetase N-terminal domain-containing protein, partial [Pseudomonadota bacterium]
MGYKEVYQRWKDEPDAFWLEQAKAIDWYSAPTQALFADDAPFYKWFADAKVNTCWNAVDR